MSAMDFNNLNYEQFEVSVNQEINESHKAKRQRLSKSKNKNLKTILIILTFTFFICCIIILILYIKKRIEYSSLEKTGKEYKPTFKMYFKATIDGDISFHDKTDKWEGYILLIKDENDNIFGGYTSKNFKGNSILDVNYGSQKNDKISFLFNLNKDEIYPVIEPNSDKHIYGDIEEGPIFGELIDSDLKIKSRFLSDKSYSEFPKNYNLKGYGNNINNNDNNKLRLTNGQKYFLIKELEAFRVILLD